MCSPGGPNSFNYMQFLGNFGKIVCWCPLGSWRPLLGEILDLSCNDVASVKILLKIEILYFAT